jgi:hypothetical protein
MNADVPQQMTPFRRFQYAFVVAVTASVCAAVLDFVFDAHMGEFILSWVFFVPVFIAGYLVAPLLARFLPYARWGAN